MAACASQAPAIPPGSSGSRRYAPSRAAGLRRNAFPTICNAALKIPRLARRARSYCSARSRRSPMPT
eukprot:867631-Pyramimonas_sp.AAC.1